MYSNSAILPLSNLLATTSKVISAIAGGIWEHKTSTGPRASTFF
jgi:hypothetical protein